MKYSHLGKVIAEQGFTAVIATISLFKEIHIWNRENLAGYFEVYLKVPLEELRRRDPKGIYRRFDSGELKEVAGLDLSIDEANEADWIEEFAPERSVDSIADDVSRKLRGII